MRPEHTPFPSTMLLLLWLSLTFVNGAWAAPKYKVLHAFGSGNDGLILYGSLARDGEGKMYGTTTGGGTYGHGIVFELMPHVRGKWTERVLHNFQQNGLDGYDSSSTLTFDRSGNLYGTTAMGGPHGYGTVFELSPAPGGWKETILHGFGFDDSKYGCCPWAGVTMDAAGNLYGTAGVAFEMSPGDAWREIVLHNFTGQNGDGYGPWAGLIFDPSGNLYGTTERGGDYKAGTAYELRPTSDGWKERILHSFPASPSDGQGPRVGALALDRSGNLYGTTNQGGANACSDVGCGTIFRLTQGSGNRWKETILFNFSPKGNGAGGFGPGAGVVLDKASNLYGTTIYGGTQCACGVVFKLAPGPKGKWKYTVLHSFFGSDGAQPDANLILDDKGNLYGTTIVGGAYGGGVVFEITP